ncbi:YhaN family protein [Martelella sp. HB161492]|uniref:ATP-binding protein n=1 Tax=Martelella sp. HB161492 TaxID=2720726 RepID=UPI00159039C8|nr:YhaN family protein [Martelella sp. HB161492]
MRFLSLDLLRYGAFTERSIAFRPDAALHIVYGPNEAGKSSTLSALSDLLFGFPERDVRYDFLHDARELRLGASLEARHGDSLAFRRRKGRKNTLLMADDKETPLHDDALSPYLGNLTRDVFERAFGLDSQRLRAGGDAMLADGGEIGSLLFSAASGLKGLRSVGRGLSDAAAQIFEPSGRSRRINQIRKVFDEAGKRERDLGLKASDWEKLNREVRDNAEALDGLDDAQKQAEKALQALRQMAGLRAVVEEIDRLESALAGFSDLAPISPEMARRIGVLASEIDDNATALAERRQDAGTLHEALQAVAVDETLLAHGAEIDALTLDEAVYRQAVEDLGEIDGLLLRSEALLAESARRIGEADASALPHRLADDMALARLAQALRDGKELAGNRKRHGEELQRAQDRLQLLEADAPGERVIDPAPLRQRFDSLSEDLRQALEADQLARTLARAERELADEAAALRPPLGAVMTVSPADLPDMDALAEAERQHRDAAQALREAEAGLLRLRSERAALESQLAEITGKDMVPSREMLTEARRERDRIWREATAQPDDQSLRLGFVDLVSRTDRLADQLLDEADRVAIREEKVRNIRRLDANIEKSMEDVQRCETRFSAVKSAIAALFAALGSAPEPGDMLVWRQDAGHLLKRRAQLRDERDRLSGLERAAAGLHAALEALAGSMLLSGGDSLPLGPLARLVADRIREIGDTFERQRGRESDLKALRGEIDRHMAAGARLAAVEADWRDGFAAALAACHLSADTVIEGGEAALEVLKQLPAQLDDHQRQTARKARSLGITESFEARARALGEAADRTLLAGHPLTIAATLKKRLGENRAAEERLRSGREQARSVAAKLEALETHEAVLRAEFATLIAALEAGVVANDLVARLLQRADLADKLSAERRHFAAIAGDADEPAIRAAIGEKDADAMAREIAGREADLGDLRRRWDGLIEERSLLRQRRDALEEGESAEMAAFTRMSAEAEALEAAREWLVTRLAADLLDQASERYRQSRADPVITAAGRHFATLTCNGFSGLGQSFDDQDNTIVTAKRIDGSEVGIAGLSDGTRDQLYLALRLAFVEDYARRNEPSPLIVDDIFQTFDDQRSLAGLRTLAGLGGVQTILFTHERALADMAGEALGDAVDMIML